MAVPRAGALEVLEAVLADVEFVLRVALRVRREVPAVHLRKGQGARGKGHGARTPVIVPPTRPFIRSAVCVADIGHERYAHSGVNTGTGYRVHARC